MLQQIEKTVEMCKELLNTVSLKITTADIGIIAGFRSQVRGEERRKEKGDCREKMKLSLNKNDNDCNNFFNFNFIHGRC